MKLPIDPATPMLEIYPKTSIEKKSCTSMFTAVLFIIAKIWKQPKCSSVDEWINKLWYIYIMEYCAEEKVIPTFCDGMVEAK